MSKEELKSFEFRRRMLFYIIEKFLNEKGYMDIAGTLKSEARLFDYEVCDNIDLDSMLLEFISFYQFKFGKHPNLLKKLNKDESIKIEIKNKPIKKELKKKIESVSTNFLLSETLQIKPFSIENSNEIMQISPNENDELPLELKEFAINVSKNLVKKDFGFRWNDIIGNLDVINIIKEAVILPLNHPELFSKSIKPWKSVLLHGPPGNGKTMIAKTLCSETLNSVSFFNISSSTITSKWRGESEKLIKVLFKVAKLNAPSIIFFDEIEALTSKRDENFENDASMRFKTEFLSLMDGLLEDNDGVFILANTNLPWIIDEAFLRRFEKKILVDLPNQNDRIALIQNFIPESTKWSNKSFDMLLDVCEGFTGDEIRIACKESKMNQIRKSLKADCKGPVRKTINEFELTKAFQQTQPGAQKSIIKHREWNKKCGHQFIKE